MCAEAPIHRKGGDDGGVTCGACLPHYSSDGGGSGVDGDQGPCSDAQAPTAAAGELVPASGGAPVNAIGSHDAPPSLTMAFSEPVRIGTGKISVYRVGEGGLPDTKVDSIVVTSGAVTGSGTTDITIALVRPWEYNAAYYVLVDAGAFVDVTESNPFAGIADKTTWAFKTAGE